MKTARRIILLCLLCAGSTYSQRRTFWQTTHGVLSQGNCQLKANSCNVTIHPFHIDIEEEATIAAHGTVRRGDPQTLEIVGEATLSPGTVLRSMLLWHGDKILKAKLKDRTAADSAYEEVVDRNAVRPVVRDPALIEWTGENRYRYKIYPVAIGESRKIRILYTVPLQVYNEGPRFSLSPFFAQGLWDARPRLEVTIKNAGNASNAYTMHYGRSGRTVQFGATYIIPAKDILPSYWRGSYSATLRIYPDAPTESRAYAYNLTEGNAAGQYTAIFAVVPNALYAPILEAGLKLYSFEAKVATGEKKFITDVPREGYFGLYLKSAKQWNGDITWTAYDTAGQVITQYDQTVEPDVESTDNAMLPLLWAAKYHSAKGSENLGSIFGFVDPDMSLLALEEDELPFDEAQKWRSQGVPELLPEEIIIDPGEIPYPPSDHIIIEILDPVSMTPVIADATGVVDVSLLTEGRILIALSGMHAPILSALLFDLRGRIVHRWLDFRPDGTCAVLTIPNRIKGTYILHVRAGAAKIQRRITIP